MSRELASKLAGKALDVVRQRLASAAADRENAPSLYRELMDRPRSARVQAVEGDETFASPALARALLERAESVLEADPPEAERLADLAATIGGRLPAEWTQLEREGVQGEARSLQGEALRRIGHLEAAREALRLAFQHFETLPAGCVERAGFCRYLARLRREQGRDDEAVALLARAIERYERHRDGRRARRCRLELAWMHLEELETEMALELFERALADEEEGGEESEGERFELWLSLRHGLALAYADLRRESSAWATLAEIAGGGAGTRGPETLRVKRAEASVLQRLDANEEAAELLFALWSGYTVAGAPFEAARSLLDLAQLRAEMGSDLDLARLKEGLTRLHGLGAPVREALRFGLDFALRHGVAAVEPLEALKSFLERSRHDPEVRFAPVLPDAQTLLWGEAEEGVRERLRAWAGVEGGAEPIEPAQRQQLAWTAGAVLGVRLLFGGKSEGREAGESNLPVGPTVWKKEGRRREDRAEIREPEPVH